jgi:hypothetical protein
MTSPPTLAAASSGGAPPTAAVQQMLGGVEDPELQELILEVATEPEPTTETTGTAPPNRQLKSARAASRDGARRAIHHRHRPVPPGHGGGRQGGGAAAEAGAAGGAAGGAASALALVEQSAHWHTFSEISYAGPDRSGLFAVAHSHPAVSRSNRRPAAAVAQPAADQLALAARLVGDYVHRMSEHMPSEQLTRTLHVKGVEGLDVAAIKKRFAPLGGCVSATIRRKKHQDGADAAERAIGGQPIFPHPSLLLRGRFDWALPPLYLRRTVLSRN